MTDFPRPMRILQVSSSDTGGGAQGSARALFQGYRARGHASWLAVGHKETAETGIVLIPEQLRIMPWKLGTDRLRTWLKPLEGRPGIGLAERCLWAIGNPKRALDRYRGIENFNSPGTARLLDLVPQRPDLIHCHNLHSHEGYFDLRLLPWLSHQAPVILNLRDAWMLSGHCAFPFTCERWKTGCGSCPDLTIYPAIARDATAYNWRRKRDIYARSRLYITTPSRWLMDQVRGSMLQGAIYRVVPNGIDLTVFQPGSKERARSELGLPPDSKIVLFVANYIKANIWKDYTTMEAAIKQVAARNPDSRLLFICLGENQATEQRFDTARVRFVAYERDPKRVSTYYQAADVYLHAAKVESFGKTITEALACGVPVVATAVGGIPEQIQDGVNGFLTSPGNAEAMAAKVELLLKDGPLAQEMGRRAAAGAGRFELNNQIDEFLSWYQEVVADWNAQRGGKGLTS